MKNVLNIELKRLSILFKMVPGFGYFFDYLKNFFKLENLKF